MNQPETYTLYHLSMNEDVPKIWFENRGAQVCCADFF